MNRLLSSLFPVLLIGAGAFFLLRDHVHFLRSYEGTVLRTYVEQINNTTSGAQDSEYMMEIRVEDGRLDVDVPHGIYKRARPGMTVRKRPFTNNVSLSP